MSLTDLQIKKLKAPSQSQKIHFDGLQRGFGIRVSKGGAKTFVLVHGKGRKIYSLGRYPDISLADARKRAVEMLAALIREKDSPTLKAVSLRFADARQRFLADAKSRNKLSTYIEYDRLLNRHFTFDKALSEITRQDCMEVITSLKDTPSTAQHAFVALRTMFNWCQLHGLIATSPVPPLKFKTGSRTRILTNEELKVVWQRAEQVGYPYGIIVQLLILTGQRRGEIAGLRRSWITDDAMTFPVGFCKNKREHRIPIGATTQKIIKSIGVNTDLLFPARGKPEQPYNGWSKAKREFDEPLKISPYILHDLRRTYSSNLAKLGVPIHVTEKLLNHVSGTISGVAAVYNRHSYWEEMKMATAQYDEFLQRLTALANPTVA